MDYFFAPDLERTTQYYILSEEEAKHGIKVMRKKNGEHIRLINGKGCMFEGIIIDNNIKHCEIKIINYIEDYNRRNYKLSIAIPVTKQVDRFEWFIEKAVEIGIDKIIPLKTERTEKLKIKKARFEKIVISAMKQSGQARTPIISELTNFQQLIGSTTKKIKNKFICHCNEDISVYKVNDLYQYNSETLILIGPEGDFTPEEINMALNKGFKAISLGNSRLRTETAGIVACNLITFLEFMNLK